MFLSQKTKNVIDSLTEENMEDQVARVLRGDRILPLSDSWHKERGKYLTASDMAAVLGKNYFSSRGAVLKKKLCKGGRGGFTGNIYTEWGNKYEKEASEVYSIVTGLPLVEEEIGFIVHEDGKYGATPDFITKSGIVVEIKCPYKRKIGSSVPIQYMAQVQFQLEVTGLNTAHFVQYYPPEDRGMDTGKGRLEITVVHRDKKWWERSKPIFDTFMSHLRIYKENNVRNILPIQNFDIV